MRKTFYNRENLNCAHTCVMGYEDKGVAIEIFLNDDLDLYSNIFAKATHFDLDIIKSIVDYDAENGYYCLNIDIDVSNIDKYNFNSFVQRGNGLIQQVLDKIDALNSSSNRLIKIDKKDEIFVKSSQEAVDALIKVLAPVCLDRDEDLPTVRDLLSATELKGFTMEETFNIYAECIKKVDSLFIIGAYVEENDILSKHEIFGL